MVFVVNLLAKGFARHVDTADDRAAFTAPISDSSIQYRNVRIAEFAQSLGRKTRPLAAFIVQNDRHGAVRNQLSDAKFNLTARQGSRIGDLTLVEFSPLAY